MATRPARSLGTTAVAGLAIAAVAAAVVVAIVLAIAVPGAQRAVAATDGSPADPAVTAAWNWIQAQQGSGTSVTSASTISAARDYPASWTGAVAGTFTPSGVTSPVTDGAAIVVDQPQSVPDDYAGTVSGHIRLTPASGRWIVQAYRDTDNGREQVPLQALVAPDGTFSIDLGAVSAPPAGSWSLGLLDASNSYAPTGTPWPGDTYTKWVVRAYVVTDAAYLVAQQPARTDGRFYFASSSPGTKVFQLVDASTGAVLAEQAPDFGLVRSYAGGTRVYAYDQALAVITAVDLHEDAATLTDGLMTLQNADGGFNESADVRNPAAAAAVQRTGITAIAAYALLRDAQALPADDATRASVLNAAQQALGWLLDQRNNLGLLTGGIGDYRSDGSLDTGAHITWVSTEHNIDAWQTLSLAAAVLGDASYQADADSLATAIVTNLWHAADGRFAEGIDPDGDLDLTDPLDVSSWGAIFLADSGHLQLAHQALEHVASFASSVGTVDGYRAYYPQPAFPNAPANAWMEGAAGVALAQQRLGDPGAAADTASALAQQQHANGALPYALVADQPTSMTTEESVAATAWFVLARLGATSIWSDNNEAPPA